MWLFLPVCPRDTNRQIMLAQTPCYYFFAFFSDFHCKSSWFNVGKQYDNILTRFVSSKNGLCVFYVPGTLWSSRRFSCHIIFWRGDTVKVDFQIMLYLYQRWYNCQFKAQFSFKPCFPWPHLCCPRDINWPWVGRYQCIWKWNSNFWLLSSWNSWLQVVVEWKICLEELLGKHNEDGTCWEKKFHLRFT